MTGEEPLKESVWYYVKSRHGKEIEGSRPTDTLALDDSGSGMKKPYLAEILGININGIRGLKRKPLRPVISSSDFSDGAVIEVSTVSDDKDERVFYAVEDNMFVPFIATWGPIPRTVPGIHHTKSISIKEIRQYWEEYNKVECPECGTNTNFDPVPLGAGYVCASCEHQVSEAWLIKERGDNL